MSTVNRIRSIDFLRGLVMIIMALDHTRDFFHAQAFTGDPLDLKNTTTFLYFTRWFTHFCAPIFVFLSGVSIYLQSLRKSPAQLSKFLFTRGLWLIFVELVVITFGITFNIYYGTLVFQVIWAIGVSMVVLSALIRFPFKAVLAIGLLIMLGHNALDYLEKTNASLSIWFSILHRPIFHPIPSGPTLAILYPVLPWIGIMSLGYCFGRIYTFEAERRKKYMLALGWGCIALFVLLRFPNIYGDPLHWSKQPTALYSILSFINTQKYPPSLLYFLMTIGPGILVLRASENFRSRLSDIIAVYGNVPFFYYILHFYILHSIAALLFLSRGHTVDQGMHGSPGLFLKFTIIGEGYSLSIVYLVWILVVIALYPLCRWYSRYRRTHNYAWLSYL